MVQSAAGKQRRLFRGKMMTLLTIIRQFTEVSNIVQHLALLKWGGVGEFYGNVFGAVIVFNTLTV